MRVNELMTRAVQKADPREDAASALRKMRSAGIRHLVVMEGGRVAGVVSDRDLGGTRGSAGLRGLSVAEVMTRAVAFAEPGTTVRQAANLLRGRVVGCLPILDGRRLVGIVTTSDLLDLLGRGAERPFPRAVRRNLRRRGPRPPRAGRG